MDDDAAPRTPHPAAGHAPAGRGVSRPPALAYHTTGRSGLFIAAEQRVLGHIRHLVHVLCGSADTDERQFPDPLALALDRENIDTHVGFGRGEHRCLGPLVARLEGVVALGAVFRRLGTVTITEPEPLRYAPALTNVSLLSLRASWA